MTDLPCWREIPGHECSVRQTERASQRARARERERERERERFYYLRSSRTLLFQDVFLSVCAHAFSHALSRAHSLSHRERVQRSTQTALARASTCTRIAPVEKKRAWFVGHILVLFWRQTHSLCMRKQRVRVRHWSALKIRERARARFLLGTTH